MKKIIGLNEPFVGKEEIKNLTSCIKSNWISSAGRLIIKFENKIAKFTKVKYAIACINGTSALQVSLKILGIKKGDEVIVPTLTFISPVSSIVLNNASPIFMDADNFHNIDSKKTIDFINNNTFFKNGFTFNKKTKKRVKAIIVVHVWGNAVDLYKLYKICKKRNIDLIEDAAESLGTVYTKGKLKNKHTGSIGNLGCLSFNGNKILTTGGGGMILTNKKSLRNLANYYINQAKDDPIRYIHNNIGYNFRMSNIQAAIGLAQFKKLKMFLKKKRTINKIYKKSVNTVKHMEIQSSPEYARNNYWMNVVTLGRFYPRKISQLINIFKKNKIQVRPVWQLNHLQKPFLKYQKYKIENAKKIIKYSLCIPSSSNLEIKEINKIVNLLKLKSSK